MRVVRCACLAASAVAFLAISCARPHQPDSLLLVTLDTVRADHLSCYGGQAPTPNLDQIARAGTLFERAWAPVPLTTPAHATILTGLYPPAHGVRNNGRFRLPDGVETLAEILRSAGRATGAVVSSFTTSSRFGLDQGFESFDDEFGNEPGGRERTERRGDEVGDRAVAWLDGHADRPFFLWVHFFDAHTPYDPPPPFAARHRADPYTGEIAFVDRQFGRVLEAIQRAGASRRTVVVVLADHGEGLGEHGEDEHGYLLYESTLHVPMLISAPGHVRAGGRVREPATAADVLPTALALLGVAPPARVHGVDLFSPAAGRARGVYAETLHSFEDFGWSALYAWRRDDLKIVEGPRTELYDLGADPRETRDLGVERGAEALALLDQLRDWAAEHVDPAQLAAAVGIGGGADVETLARLESLGYVGGGGGVDAGSSEGLPSVGGRNPRDAMPDLGRFEEAQAMLARGATSQAVEEFERLVAGDPHNPQFLLKLAAALQRAGRDADAETRYRALLEVSPTFYLGYRAYSDFLEKRGRALESRDIWLRLAAMVPGYVGLEARIARAETAAGRSGHAAARLERHLVEHPEDHEAWAELGSARAASGRTAGALEAFGRALELAPTDRGALAGALDLLIAGGRTSEAIALADAAVARAPADPGIRSERARLGPP